DGLKTQLMAREAVRACVAEFHRELNRLNCSKQAQADAARRELAKIEREIAALVEAVKRGAFSTALQRELAALEARQAALGREVAQPAPAPVIFHPNPADIYRQKVAHLHP